MREKIPLQISLCLLTFRKWHIIVVLSVGLLIEKFGEKVRDLREHACCVQDRWSVGRMRARQWWYYQGPRSQGPLERDDMLLI